MLEFKEICILTGVEQRKSKKTGETYRIVNFLGENGQIFSCMLESDVPAGLKQLDKVEVNFKVYPGRFTQLKVLGIKKVE